VGIRPNTPIMWKTRLFTFGAHLTKNDADKYRNIEIQV